MVRKSKAVKKGTPRNGKEGRPIRYDWNEWFGKPEFTLVYGKDYTTSQSTMTNNVRNAAVRYGLKVSVSDRGDRLVVTVGRKWVLE